MTLDLDLDMDERTFDPERTLFGQDIPECSEEFAAAKVDVWCTWTGLTSAARRLRLRTGLPDNAPIQLALDRVNDPLAEQAAEEFALAVHRFEGARVALGKAREE
ncbi:hypothetical protein [Actinomadura violacea]|uniref:Uncharacterized protein n=1 Tax=Actinomadura violacea TaxID=2819934 RepID=A0ABS3S5J5_9ACTN|nr:hypothetical protein [Actinomadura violacea]MBO2464013.1 hypothetical protein [Actinomadura violacea]